MMEEAAVGATKKERVAVLSMNVSDTQTNTRCIRNVRPRPYS